MTFWYSSASDLCFYSRQADPIDFVLTKAIGLWLSGQVLVMTSFLFMIGSRLTSMSPDLVEIIWFKKRFLCGFINVRRVFSSSCWPYIPLYVVVIETVTIKYDIKMFHYCLQLHTINKTWYKLNFITIIRINTFKIIEMFILPDLLKSFHLNNVNSLCLFVMAAPH